MTRFGRVVVLGSFNVDHVWSLATLPQPGETLAGEYHSGPGGKGFNQATAAARAGAATTFVCALGDDAGGRLARELCSADDIVLHASPSDAPTGTAGIYVDRDGSNTIVIGSGANAALTEGFVHSQAAALSDAAVALGQLESPVAAVLAGFRVARKAGAMTVLNPAPADADLPLELLELSDLLTPNESEFCAQLARHHGDELPARKLAALDDTTLHRHCRKLQPNGSIVITLGANGSFVSHAPPQLHGDDREFYRVAATSARVVDTTGAGDAFNGALVASIAQLPSLPFVRHIEFATHYAARATEQTGAARAMPYLLPEAV